MKDKVYHILAAIVLCLFVTKYATIPIYKHIFAKPEIVKPMPERSVMIKRGTGLQPTEWIDPSIKTTGHYEIVIESDSTNANDSVTVYWYFKKD